MTHYVFGAVLAVVLALALVMMYFYRQINYLRRTMGGAGGGAAGGGGGMGLGYFSPAKYIESFAMLFVVMFPLSFNMYGSMKDTLATQLYTRLLTFGGDAEVEVPFVGTIYQPCKTFVGVSAVLGCLFIFVSGWFKEAGPKRTLLRWTIWCGGLVLAVQATHDFELSLAVVLVINFGPLRLVGWMHWIMWSPYLLTADRGGSIDFEEEDFERDAETEAMPTPSKIRLHKQYQMTPEQFEAEAGEYTRRHLLDLSNKLQNDADYKSSAKK